MHYAIVEKINEITGRQHFGLTQEIPIPKDVEKEIESRVELEVDKAIRDYERLTGDTGTVKIPSPKYIEKPIDNSLCYTEDCKSLGGEMRLCAPWSDNCKDSSESGPPLDSKDQTSDNI